MTRKKQDSLERVPPYLPIIWQDWDSSIDIQNMSLAEEGIFFRLLRKLWVLDELSGTPRRLAQLIRVPDYRTMERWLEKYAHLLSVDKAHTRECTVNLREIYRNLTVDVRETTCECPVKIRSEKLRNLKNNVKNNVGLGANLTKPNLNQTEPLSVSQSVSYEEAEASLEEEEFDEQEDGVFEITDKDVPVSELPCFSLLHSEFGCDTELPEETIRRVHSALKVLGKDESWMQGCIQFALGHKRFWAKRVFNAKTFADMLISGIKDSDGKKLPAQYNQHIVVRRRSAGAGKK